MYILKLYINYNYRHVITVFLRSRSNTISFTARFCMCGYTIHEGGVFFFGKPADINGGRTKYVQAINGRMLDTDSSNAQPPSLAASHGNESYNLRAIAASEIIRVPVPLYGHPLFEGGIYFY